MLSSSGVYTRNFDSAKPGEAQSYRLNVQQYAIRQWRKRGIPEDHWLRLAELAAVPVDEIWNAHRAVRGTLAASAPTAGG